MKNSLLFALLICLTIFTGCSSSNKTVIGTKSDYLFTITTDMGEIKLVLFDETPRHKNNFVKLVQSGFYDGTTFHRVLDNFMIQGGDPNSKEGASEPVGNGGPGYQLEAEFVERFKHDRGVIAAARLGDSVNPTFRSSGSQFYIVQNKKGAHHLDGKYTVFGKVVEGMEVVDKIAEQKVDRKGSPSAPIRMKIDYVKLKRKQLAEMYGAAYQ